VKKNAVDQLSDDFVFLRPDHFSQLYMSTQSPNREINEFFSFIYVGLIPLIGFIVGLTFLFFFRKKNLQEKSEISLKSKKILNNLIFFAIDTQLLLIMRICFYSTILNLVFFFIFLIAMTIGIFSKKYLERLIGIKENLIGSLILLIIGNILFFISPEFIFISGFTLGILLTFQIQSSKFRLYCLDRQKILQLNLVGPMRS